MEKPSENININTSNEVRQNSFDERIESILDSIENFKIDFYDVFDSLPKTKQKTFVREVYEWISSVKFVRYYDRKYIRSRKKENPIFNYDQLDFIRAEQEDYLFLKGVRDHEGLKYPATEIWIKRKTEEIKNFFEELELLYFSIQEKESLFGSKTTTDNSNQNEYQFPSHLIDSTFDIVSIDSSYRINIKLSLETLKEHFEKPLKLIETSMDEENYTAFLYNSFNFKDNKTPITTLRLEKATSDGVFKKYIFGLYTSFKKNYGVEKETFAKILFNNFQNDRARCFKPDFDFETHFENLTKYIR